MNKKQRATLDVQRMIINHPNTVDIPCSTARFLLACIDDLDAEIARMKPVVEGARQWNANGAEAYSTMRLQQDVDAYEEASQ